jgi:hypothetical protein
MSNIQSLLAALDDPGKLGQISALGWRVRHRQPKHVQRNGDHVMSATDDIGDFHKELVDVLTGLTRIVSQLHLLQHEDDPALAVLVMRARSVLERLSTADAVLEPIRLQ